ncbi:hypothetical protein [Marinobacter sp.]|jgi:hypothetical protein|uniref:hypothetical protein n=1 Tax=Marinobacter sp. TaxID=50741 RepID=UPI000C96933D|nr:hypothetical protein [Marinobacter sp.]MAK51094.1 hypothetical protein [Marinobacter sp.]|tara:strand:- start:20 stop:832 length:813 start_codon:yes stop_codon:yes gene_type:complete
MAQSKAVQKKEATEVAVLDTSMFEADADFNTGDLSSDDLALPFIDIIQATSSKHLKGIKGSVPGMMVNVVSSQTYPGDEGMIVVPCAYQRRFLEWVERGENSTVTGKKHAYPLNKWAPEDKDRPTTEKRDGDNFDWIPGQNHYVEETFYHYVLVLEEDGRHTPALFSMSRTQGKKSKKWNSMVASQVMQGKNGSFQPPRFAYTYNVVVVEESSDQNNWYGFDVKLHEQVKDPNVYAAAKAFANSIMQGEVIVRDSQDIDTSSDESDDVPF